jgi:hypothetical protein
MIELIAIATAGLIILHRVDGGEVLINPAQITSLRNMDGKYRALQPNGNCAVDLTDRKFVVVRETCTQVKRLLESAQ